MPKVIKPDRLVLLDNVVYIPDSDPAQQSVFEDEPVSLEQEIEESSMEEERLIRIVTESNAQSSAVKTEDLPNRVLQVAQLEREKILEQARLEAGRIREQAWQDGWGQAQEEFQAQVEDCVSQVNQLLDELQEKQQEYFIRYESELKHVALDIAEKVLQKTVFESSTEMNELVKQAVSSVKNADWVTVELSDKLVTLVHQLKREFSQEGSRSVEFVLKSMPNDSCIIRTPEGSFDASVPVQLENLKNLFDKLEEQ